jgi:hypothetical protein
VYLQSAGDGVYANRPQTKRCGQEKRVHRFTVFHEFSPSSNTSYRRRCRRRRRC